jgi:CHAD domain-containing protein
MLLQTEGVQKSIVRLRKFLKKKPNSPTPEKLHKKRTSARRLESSLAAMDIGKKRLKKRLERNLPALRKRLGKVRDMDVLTAHVISIAPKAPAKGPERECLVQLLEHLGAKRSGPNTRRGCERPPRATARDYEMILQKLPRKWTTPRIDQDKTALWSSADSKPPHLESLSPASIVRSA